MPKRFLVIQTAFLGDAVLATALLEKLHAFYPDAVIDLVVRKGNDGLFDGHPFLRKLFVWNKRTYKTRNLFKLIGELRKERYDHIINCQRFFSTGLITTFSKGNEKVGYDKNPLSFSFTRKVKHVIGDGRHEVDRLNALIEHLTDRTRPLPMLHPTGVAEQALPGIAAPADLSARYVTIAPGSVWFTKTWPMQKWIELVLSFPADLQVVVIGGPEERALGEVLSREVAIRHQNKLGISNPIRKPRNLAGKLSLLQTAALMRDAAMNYVNDSAPLHIASAMNAPVTAVFCSTVPAFGFGPLRENGRVVETAEKLDCRPCGLHGYASCPKGHFKCALGIEAVRVAS